MTVNEQLRARLIDAARALDAHAPGRDAADANLPHALDPEQEGSQAFLRRRAMEETLRALMGTGEGAEHVGLRPLYGLDSKTLDALMQPGGRAEKLDSLFQILWRQQVIERINRDLEELADMQRRMDEIDKEMQRLYRHLAHDENGNIDYDFYARLYLPPEEYTRTQHKPEDQIKALDEVLLDDNKCARIPDEPLAKHRELEYKKDNLEKCYDEKRDAFCKSAEELDPEIARQAKEKLFTIEQSKGTTKEALSIDTGEYADLDLAALADSLEEELGSEEKATMKGGFNAVAKGEDSQIAEKTQSQPNSDYSLKNDALKPGF